MPHAPIKRKSGMLHVCNSELNYRADFSILSSSKLYNIYIYYYLLYLLPSKYHLMHDITQNGLLQVMKPEI